MCYLVPGPMPCPEVVAISYIRQAEVLTLFSVEGDAQVKQKNHEHGFLTPDLPGYEAFYNGARHTLADMDPRYEMPKAYRPTTLLNTMCKILAPIVADLVTYYTEKHNHLLPHHVRGRPGWITTDVLYLLIQRIKGALRKYQVISVLFLNIEGAFLNAVTNKLSYNMRNRGLPEMLINFAGSMLEKRSATLQFNDHSSEVIALNNGIGQKDPLFMALSQYYNADILNIPRYKHELAEAYVDNDTLSLP